MDALQLGPRARLRAGVERVDRRPLRPELGHLGHGDAEAAGPGGGDAIDELLRRLLAGEQLAEREVHLGDRGAERAGLVGERGTRGRRA